MFDARFKSVGQAAVARTLMYLQTLSSESSRRQRRSEPELIWRLTAATTGSRSDGQNHPRHLFSSQNHRSWKINIFSTIDPNLTNTIPLESPWHVEYFRTVSFMFFYKFKLFEFQICDLRNFGISLNLYFLFVQIKYFWKP